MPVDLEKALQKWAKKEHRTLSGILQEAARSYINLREWEDLQKTFRTKGHELGLKSEDDVDTFIHQARGKRSKT